MSAREETPSERLGSPGFTVALTWPRAGTVYSALLLLTFGLGLGLRLRAVFGDFPSFDGGMFYAMIGDVQEAGYRLPKTTSYNGGEIPFSYPPLAFYLAAVLNDVLGISRTALMQLLPALASTATIGAFFLLADGLLKSRWAVLTATFAFAVMPETFSWMIVGGGLTRSFGLLFAVLALSQLLRMYTRPERLYVATSAAFVALTILSHLEMTLFLALSAGVMFAFYGWNRRGATRTLVVVLAAFVVTAPWWATVISREGLSPWLDTGSSRNVFGLDALGALLRLNLTQQSFVDMLGLLAILGLLICVVRREYFLLCWLVAIALLMPWVFTRMASVPASLLVGYTLIGYIWPWLKEGLPGMRLRAPPPLWLAPCFVGVLVVSSTVSGVKGDGYLQVALSDDTQAAMQWASTNTEPDDRFVVVTGRMWYHDYVAEWFPAVSHRESVSTIQGKEWLGDFDKQTDRQRSLGVCIYETESCLTAWERRAGTSFEYVFVSREAAPEFEARDMPECCATLRNSLLESDDYRVVFQNDAATIFARRGGEQAGR